MNMDMKTFQVDKPVSASETETRNLLEHIKRLALDTQQTLKSKPDRDEVASMVGQEVEASKREILSAIPATMPVTQEFKESGLVALRPGVWFGLILVLVVVIAGATAWQTWEIHKLDNTIYGELDQLYKEIQKHERR